MSGLLVPAGSAVPLSLCQVEDSATSISDLLGGVLLDDPHVLPLGDGTAVTVYQGEDRASLPVNERLCVLVTRLGTVDRGFHATTHGDALILGVTRQAVDIDMPDAVTVAAHQCGYRIAGPVPSSASTRAEAVLPGSVQSPGALSCRLRVTRPSVAVPSATPLQGRRPGRRAARCRRRAPDRTSRTPRPGGGRSGTGRAGSTWTRRTWPVTWPGSACRCRSSGWARSWPGTSPPRPWSWPGSWTSWNYATPPSATTR